MSSERKFVTENIRRVLLKEYLMKAVDRAGFGGVDVQRTPMGTRVTLITERPGIVIGRRGAAIKMLTTAIEKDFKFDNPQVEVQEVDNANLNAQIMAEKLAFALERGWHFRRAGHSTVRRVMDAGARGCHVVIAGKLTGERHRTEKFKEGYIKFCGEPKLKFVRKGFAVAKLKPGVIGVKVEIMAPDARLPDETDVMTLEEAVKILPDLIDKIMPKQQSALAEAVRLDEEATAKEDAQSNLDEPKAEHKKEASS
jgi:small subunit ribosomal protein S3